jgi:hypothetical protein
MSRYLRAFAILIMIRGSYAVALFVAVSLHRADLANPLGITGYFDDLTRNLPIWLTVAWFTYSVGYLASGWLALRGQRIALWTYALAMAIDFSIWVLAATNTRYDMIGSGSVAVTDMFFNTLDLIILLGLAVLAFNKDLR